ncbi:MAG: hypothetical protein ABJQ90_09120 [Parasphingorhabdus sp.]
MKLTISAKHLSHMGTESTLFDHNVSNIAPCKTGLTGEITSFWSMAAMKFFENDKRVSL